MVDKDGVLDYSRHNGFIHPLVTKLAERGFPCEPQSGDSLQEGKQSVLCIEIPLEGFLEAALGNLEKMVLRAKQRLSKRQSVQKLCR